MAVLYVLVGLLSLVVGGAMIEKDAYGAVCGDFVLYRGRAVDMEAPALPAQRPRAVCRGAGGGHYFKKVFPFILVGVGIGAVIHNWIPQTG